MRKIKHDTWGVEIKKVLPSLIFTAILVAIDMFIKIVIDNFFMDKVLVLWGQFGFKPYLNTMQLSIFNNELNLGISTATLIVINAVMIPLLHPTFLYLYHKGDLDDRIFVVERFLMAGMICSLFDKVFWGGSLDYIYLCGRWIVDLKDIYLTIAVLLYIYCAITSVIVQKRMKNVNHTNE